MKDKVHSEIIPEISIGLPYGHGILLHDLVRSVGLLPKQMYGFIVGSFGRHTISLFCTPGKATDGPTIRWIAVGENLFAKVHAALLRGRVRSHKVSYVTGGPKKPIGRRRGDYKLCTVYKFDAG